MSPDDLRALNARLSPAVSTGDGNPVAFDESVRALYDGLPDAHRALVASVLAQDLADAEREFESLTARMAVVRARRDAFRQRLDYLKRISTT